MKLKNCLEQIARHDNEGVSYHILPFESGEAVVMPLVGFPRRHEPQAESHAHCT